MEKTAFKKLTDINGIVEHTKDDEEEHSHNKR